MAKTSGKTSSKSSSKSSKGKSYGKSTGKSTGYKISSGSSKTSKTYGSTSKSTPSSVSSLGKLGSGDAKTTIKKMSSASSGITKTGGMSGNKISSAPKSNISPVKSSAKSINVMSTMGISKTGSIPGAKGAVTKSLTGGKSVISMAKSAAIGKMTLNGGTSKSDEKVVGASIDTGTKGVTNVNATVATGLITGGKIPATIAQAGGEDNFRAALVAKYPHASEDRLDHMMSVQKVKEGTLSASSVFGTPSGMSPAEFDYIEASAFRGKGNAAPLTHSEQVAAFNIASGNDNATSKAYKDALASDLAKGFNVQDYSNVSDLTQSQISTDAASRLAAGQDVKALTPSYSDFRAEYANSPAHSEHGYAGFQNNWNAYKEGWITREEALSGAATHMPTVGVPSKHPSEAYIPPGYNWDSNLGIMTRPDASEETLFQQYGVLDSPLAAPNKILSGVEIGEATNGGIEELQAYDNKGNTLSQVIPEAPKRAAVSYMVG